MENIRVAIAGVGYGAYQTMTPATSGYAEVVNVDPIVKTWQEPREVCQQVTVQRKKPVKDEHRITGSVVGAVVGGGAGHGHDQAGVVLELLWRCADMEQGQVCPYKVGLDDGTVTWAPFDDDDTVTAEAAKKQKKA